LWIAFLWQWGLCSGRLGRGPAEHNTITKTTRQETWTPLPISCTEILPSTTNNNTSASKNCIQWGQRKVLSYHWECRLTVHPWQQLMRPRCALVPAMPSTSTASPWTIPCTAAMSLGCTASSEWVQRVWLGASGVFKSVTSGCELTGHCSTGAGSVRNYRLLTYPQTPSTPPLLHPIG